MAGKDYIEPQWCFLANYYYYCVHVYDIHRLVYIDTMRFIKSCAQPYHKWYGIGIV